MDTKGKMMLGAYLGFAVGCLVWVMKVFTPAIIFGGLFGSTLMKTIFGLEARATMMPEGMLVIVGIVVSVIGSLICLVLLGVGAGAGIGRFIAIMTNKSPEKA